LKIFFRKNRSFSGKLVKNRNFSPNCFCKIQNPKRQVVNNFQLWIAVNVPDMVECYGCKNNVGWNNVLPGKSGPQ